MNLRDDEWEPAATDGALLRRIKGAVKGAVSAHDVSVLRATLLAPPLNGAVPHEARGAVWLLLLGLRPEDLLSEDAGDFARAAREAVCERNAADQIDADVARTRPGLARFKQPAVRGALLRLLSLFCERKEVGYTQGLNELLAPFVLLADTGGNPRIVFALFSAFLERFAPWMLDSSESRVFDVLKRAFKYFGRLLLYHDPELFWRLEQEGMTPDLYATSWFVTLFARNFTVETVLALWDLLLLEDNPLGTCFFGLALLLERRDELMRIDSSRLPETLMMLGVQSPAQVQTLWAAAGVLRAGRTPPSFQRLMSDRLLHMPSDPSAAGKGIDAARFMQASVCLQTTPDDLTAGEAQYFTWDCRTRAEYDSGHLAQAAHLPLDGLRNCLGEWRGEARAEAELEAALRFCAPLKGSSHICLVGSGNRDEDAADINAVALYLTERGVPYVSTLRGGFRAALAAASDDESLFTVDLVDYDLAAHEAAVLSRRAERDNAARRRAMAAAGARALATAQDGEAAFRNSMNNAANAAASAFSSAASSAGYGGVGASEGVERGDASVPFGVAGGGGADGEGVYGGVGRVLNGLGMRLSAGVGFGGADGQAGQQGGSPDYGENVNPFSPNSVASAGQSPRLLEEFGSMVTESSRDGAPSPRHARGGVLAQPDLPAIKRSLSNVAGPTVAGSGVAVGGGGDGVRLSGVASAESSPRMMEVPSSTISPRPGITAAVPADGGVDTESPIRKKGPGKSSVVGGFFGGTKSPWGRDARPGWLNDDSLALPLSAMPKGFTVNVMDDRVMAGLRLFPCRARSDRAVARSGKSGEFKRRYVGVCSNYFMLLSPHSNRAHLLEVKLIRLLQDIVRITFKRSRPELVTFEILGAAEGEVPNEHIVCIMPDGLSECVELIKDYLGQKEDDSSSSAPPSPSPSADKPADASFAAPLSAATTLPPRAPDASARCAAIGTAAAAAAAGAVASGEFAGGAESAEGAGSRRVSEVSASDGATERGSDSNMTSDSPVMQGSMVVEDEDGARTNVCSIAKDDTTPVPLSVERVNVSEVSGALAPLDAAKPTLSEERRVADEEVVDDLADDVSQLANVAVGEVANGKRKIRKGLSEDLRVPDEPIDEEVTRTADGAVLSAGGPVLKAKSSKALSEEDRVAGDSLEDEDGALLTTRSSGLIA